MKYIIKMWDAYCCYSQHACYSLWVFFQFRITPQVKLYLRKGVTSCCHLGCKSSVTDFSGSCNVLYWFPECFHMAEFLNLRLPYAGLLASMVWLDWVIFQTQLTAVGRHIPQDTARLPQFHPYPHAWACLQMEMGTCMMCVLSESHHFWAKTRCFIKQEAAWGHQKA